ncbi:MAG: acyl-CoA thioester hydrolase [Bradymonadia bacterium]|jgi:acyl-CoA thioester hydrolase
MSWSMTIEVAWGDMDAFGHVNNTRYFSYFEIARIAWFQDVGVMPDGEVGEVGPILASTSCRFKVPVKFPDTLTLEVEVFDVGEDRFSHRYTAHSESLGRIAAIGEALVVAYHYKAGAKSMLPTGWSIA